MEKLIVQPLNTQAYDLIKSKIFSGEIKPGTRLVDSQLAEEFGISRTPFRDALRKLCEEGFVACEPGKKGYFVYQPSRKDIDDIFELRLILDLAAADKLVHQILPGNTKALELLKNSYHTDQVDVSSFVKKDEDFHDTIIKLCDNQKMLEMYNSLRSQLRAFRSKTSQDETRRSKATNYHAKILEGLCDLDYEKACAAMKKHVELSREDALKDYLADDVK
ncbi:MAG: GntR family transcriptional regulator [Oscillospiraceae bacterium]|nr:GntR family transcriptional regulator [Oscillospiraceae bacterium]